MMCQILKANRTSTTADVSVRIRRRRPTATVTILTQVVVSCLIIQQKFQNGSCFVPNTVGCAVFPRHFQLRDPHSHKATRIALAARNSDDDDDNRTIGQRVDEFLDKPFFDPDNEAARQEEEGEGSSSLKSWFARLVIEDYASAEALYAGLFFSFLLLVTQEALRYYMYGAEYVPFSRVGGGKLF